MKALFAVVALVGCASQPDVTEPLVSETTSELAFDIADLSAGDTELTIDLGAETIAGFRFVLRDDATLCRRQVGASAMGDMPRLRAVLAASSLHTLGEDTCAAATLGCGGDFGHELGVRVDGGERYSETAPCRQLLSGPSLEAELLRAFQDVPAVDELVQWNGTGYDVIGECALGGVTRL